MTPPNLPFKSPPIVEAVLDIEADLPAAFNLEELIQRLPEDERNRYPETVPVHFESLRIDGSRGKSEPDMERGIEAYRLFSADQLQVVQFRRRGFSFNRLAPYSGLDAYLPEVENWWRLFVTLAEPMGIVAVKLRFINKISIATDGDGTDLRDYFKVAPKFTLTSAPKGTGGLIFDGVRTTYTARDAATGQQVLVTLASDGVDNNVLPLFLDIQTIDQSRITDPKDWPALLETIESLRKLKNLAFYGALEDKCLPMFA